MSEVKTFSLNYRPRKWQKWVHSNLKRFNLLVVARRSGKSVLCVMEAIHRGLSHPDKHVQIAYLAPSYAQAKRVIWLYFKEFLGEYPGAKFSEKDLSVTLPKGKGTLKFMLLGASEPDNLRGVFLHGCLLDEWADCPQNVWSEILLPALSDKKGWAIFIGTVKGRNHFYKQHNSYKVLMQENPEMYFTANLTAEDVKVLTPEDLKILKDTMTEEEYAAEMMNDFGAGSKDKYYANYMDKARVDERITAVPLEPLSPVDVYMDIGVSDYTSIWFRQRVGKEFRYIDFEESSGWDVSHVVKLLREKGYTYGRIVLPHDARQRSFQTGNTVEESFHTAGLRVEVQDKQSVQDGINAVRLHLGKSWFDQKKCAKGIEHLEMYRKQFDQRKQVFSNKPVHDEHSHGADAFRYSALDERPSLEEMQRRRSSLPSGADVDYDIFSY